MSRYFLAGLIGALIGAYLATPRTVPTECTTILKDSFGAEHEITGRIIELSSPVKIESPSL